MYRGFLSRTRDFGAKTRDRRCLSDIPSLQQRRSCKESQNTFTFQRGSSAREWQGRLKSPHIPLAATSANCHALQSFHPPALSKFSFNHGSKTNDLLREHLTKWVGQDASPKILHLKARWRDRWVNDHRTQWDKSTRSCRKVSVCNVHRQWALGRHRACR